MTNPTLSAAPLDEAALRESVKRAIFLQKSPADKPCALYLEDEDLPEILDTIMSICQRYAEQKAISAQVAKLEQLLKYWQTKKLDTRYDVGVTVGYVHEQIQQLRAAQAQHSQAAKEKE